MRIAFNIEHDIHMMVRGGKRIKSVKRLEAAEIEISEYDAADAPVVATWQAVPNSETSRFHRNSIRFCDGQLYMPQRQSVGRVDLPEMSVEEIVRAFGSGGRDRSEAMPPDAAIWHLMGNDKDIQTDKRWKRLNRIAIVDGLPHVRCEPPRIFVSRYVRHNQKNVTWTPGYSSYYSRFGIDRTVVFQLDEAEEADLFSRRDGMMAENLVRDVTIIDPVPLQFDKDIEKIGRTVGQAVVVNRETMHRWPRRAIDAYLDLSERNWKWLEDPASEDVVDMLDSAYDLFTSGAYYFDQDVASFFSNYDALQPVIADMAISIDTVRRPMA